MAGLFSMPEVLQAQLVQVSYDGKCSDEISYETKIRWLKQCKEWGFLDTECSVVAAHAIAVNVTRFIAACTMVRYLAEFPDLVKWWDRKVYHEKHPADPWLLFLAGHMGGGLLYGHTLVHSNPTKVVDVRAVNKAFPPTGGFLWGKREKIHVIYGGCEYTYEPNVKFQLTPSDEDLSTYLQKLERLRETQSAPAPSASGTGAPRAGDFPAGLPAAA